MSNLPPGVTVGMIPGNRPEDEWYDKFLDSLSEVVMLETDPVQYAEELLALARVIERHRSEAYRQGREEERMAPTYPAGMVLVPVDSLPPGHEYHP